MKTLTLKLTNLFSFENVLLKTKHLFLLLKPKPAMAVAEPAPEASDVYCDFQLLSNNALIPFAKKIIFGMDGNSHYLYSKRNMDLLFHSVIELDNALMVYKSNTDLTSFKYLKFKRMMVLHNINEILKIVKATATLHPENAVLIISDAGFGIK